VTIAERPPRWPRCKCAYLTLVRQSFLKGESNSLDGEVALRYFPLVFAIPPQKINFTAS
jgi:hypothetical protein